MDQSNNPNNINKSGEISLTDLIAKAKSAITYIRDKWVSILIISIIGGLLGLCYSILKKPNYTAVCTFVLEDAKSGGGLSQYSGLASLAGINLGSGGGGIFEGDNILQLYSSRTMIEKTLLTSCSFDGKNKLLINRYIDFNRLRDKWENDNQLTNIKFNINPDSLTRWQDSIITDIVGLFNKSVLNISKPDKKLSIISVEVTTKDEQFSKCFTEKLVQNVNDFYIQTKTKKAYQNVEILQRQADSVKNILNSSINSVASAIDADPNANPQMLTLRVASQKRQVDVQANEAIYSEIVKNLEIEKIDLRQEMPLIQVIDKPVFPLLKDHISKIKGVFIGVIFGLIFSIILITAVRLTRKI
jgi:hypothetical protein